jgi:hypothetical protein
MLYFASNSSINVYFFALSRKMKKVKNMAGHFYNIGVLVS